MRTRGQAKFAPEEPSTVGEYLVSVQHLFGLSKPEKPVVFTDVPPDSPYYDAVQATAKYLNRQVTCFGCALSTNLYPDQAITNAQSTVTLVSILNARGSLPFLTQERADRVLANVSDGKDLNPVARRYLATALSGGIITLTPEHKIEPSRVETRADVALTLNRTQVTFRLPEVDSRPDEH